MTRFHALRALTLALPMLAACGDETPSAVAPRDAATDTATGTRDAAADTATGPSFTASCVYNNAFSRAEECRDYIDPNWTEASVATDCANSRGTLRMGTACSYPAALGQCELRLPNTDATRLTFPGNDPSQCAATQRGCAVFARGSFTPLGVCAGDGGVGDASVSDGSAPAASVFLPPVRDCRPPRAGEPRGNGPDGQVCTWVAISGSTEAGRRYEDYASCDHVRTQRPYYPAEPGRPRGDDARMRDPAYVAELNWVRSQIASSACVCCHSTRAPEGPSNWYLEAPGNWIDSFDDTGLALGANWIDSRALGAYPPGENNGFDRVHSGMPSTEPERMVRFFQQELMHRGRTRESFASAEPFGGPIYDQLVYTPSACTGTDGLAADGTLRWTGGGARYVYVLDGGSASPGVPPNLDLPMGTRWRLDVAPTDAPLASGVTYGRVPTGATQRFPATGAPAALVGGATYYLYVLADVGIPITRCTFTAPR